MERLDAARLAFDHYMSAIGETDPDPQQAGDYVLQMLEGLWELVESEGYSPPLIAMRSLRRYSDSKGAA